MGGPGGYALGRRVEDTHWRMLVRHRMKIVPKAALEREIEAIVLLALAPVVAVQAPSVVK